MVLNQTSSESADTISGVAVATTSARIRRNASRAAARYLASAAISTDPSDDAEPTDDKRPSLPVANGRLYRWDGEPSTELLRDDYSVAITPWHGMERPPGKQTRTS